MIAKRNLSRQLIHNRGVFWCSCFGVSIVFDSEKVVNSVNLSLECPHGPYFGVLSLAFFLTSPPVMICDDALDLEFDEELGLLPPRAPDDVCCGGEVTNEVEGGL